MIAREAPGERRLVVIPMLHTETDLGELSDRVRRETVAHAGRRAWERKQRAIERLWSEITEWSERVAIPEAGMRLYQDGLPVCGPGERDVTRTIVEDLGTRGSLNHRILLSLIERGATLEGTESPELLLAEYRLARGEAEQDGDGTPAAHDLLEQRDRFIAQRIDATLEPHQVGVLFIGYLHNIPPHLPAGITVEHPFDVAEALSQGAHA
ncbi:MAG: hypothetical protein AAGI30_00875 [Planctomycetota bacterium]